MTDTRNGWTWEPQHGKAPAPQVHEKDPKPVLYDNHNRPLVKKRDPVGFRPPR